MAQFKLKRKRYEEALEQLQLHEGVIGPDIFARKIVLEMIQTSSEGN